MIDLTLSKLAIGWCVGVCFYTTVMAALVWHAMRNLRRQRNTLEQALAETNQMRGIAMQAMAKGPY